jgi:ABC-2 type transport system permease protein
MSAVVTARVVGQSALVGVAEFRTMYTARTWVSSWLLRMIAQVAFFATIGLLLEDSEQVRFLLIGNAVALICLDATITVMSVAAERWQGTLPLLEASPASPIAVYLGRGLVWLGTGMVTSLVTLTVLPPLFGAPLSVLRVLGCLPVLLVIAVTSYAYAVVLGSLVIRFLHLDWLVLNLGYLLVMTFAGVNVPVSFWPGPVQVFSHMLPVTHGLRGIRLLLGGADAGAVLAQVGYELLVGAGWLAVALLSFNRFVARGRADGSIDRR